MSSEKDEGLYWRAFILALVGAFIGATVGAMLADAIAALLDASKLE